jgi:hypothetical protein
LKLYFAANLSHQLWVWDLDVQIDVTAFLPVVQTRAKQSHIHPLAEHSGCGAFDGLDLIGGQAHGVIE